MNPRRHWQVHYALLIRRAEPKKKDLIWCCVQRWVLMKRFASVKPKWRLAWDWSGDDKWSRKYMELVYWSEDENSANIKSKGIITWDRSGDDEMKQRIYEASGKGMQRQHRSSHVNLKKRFLMLSQRECWRETEVMEIVELKNICNEGKWYWG